MASDRVEEGLVERLRRREVGASRELFSAYLPAAWSYCATARPGLPIQEAVERALARSLAAIRGDPSETPDLDGTVLRSLRETTSGRIPLGDRDERLAEAERAFRQALPTTVDPPEPDPVPLGAAEPPPGRRLLAVLVGLLALATLVAVVIAAVLVLGAGDEPRGAARLPQPVGVTR